MNRELLKYDENLIMIFRYKAQFEIEHDIFKIATKLKGTIVRIS